MDQSTAGHENNKGLEDTIVGGKPEYSNDAQDSDKERLTPLKELVSSQAAEKADAIHRACDLRDLDALVLYATSEGGFLRDDLRQQACKSVFCLLLVEHKVVTMSQGRFYSNVIRASEITISKLGASYHHIRMKIKCNWTCIGHSFTIQMVSDIEMQEINYDMTD